MAMSPAERKRAQRAREAVAKERLGDDTHEFLRAPFFEHANDDPNWSDIALYFLIIGYEPPVFEDDRGPEEFSHPDAFPSDQDRDECFAITPGSIGRAEILADHLFAAAQELAGSINRYKKAELNARLREMETADLSDPEARREAFQQGTRIQKILDELDKRQRLEPPKWTVKGT